jgi:2-polyprenyl-6-methoxyphenol hydroxylase-like FAD-dependent oxidoreductase
VTLLGDAAHTTTPNLGQGACQAIEDAVDLAGCFRNGAIPEAILRAYEDMRIPRTTTITNQSLRLGILGQLQNPLACTLRDTVVRFMPPAISLRFMESILHHSAPDLP